MSKHRSVIHCPGAFLEIYRNPPNHAPDHSKATTDHPQLPIGKLEWPDDWPVV